MKYRKRVTDGKGSTRLNKMFTEIKEKCGISPME